MSEFKCPFCGATEPCEHAAITRTCGDCDGFIHYSGKCMTTGDEVDAKTKIPLMTETGEWTCIQYQRNENPCRTCKMGAICREWPGSLRCQEDKEPMTW